MEILKFLLFPLAVSYDTITKIRNFLFDKGWKKSTSFDTPFTIVLGNLTVGGTGKTPHTEYLIAHLKKDFKVAMLSRGYGRKTKGYRIAQTTDTAIEIGDEPLQVFNRFKREVPVIVAEQRVMGIQNIQRDFPTTDMVILDDAFQHRALSPHLKILISRYDKPFYSDFLLPTGLLRERRSGARRADAVIISKSPTNLSAKEKEEVEKKVQRYSRRGVPVFFTSLVYKKAYSLAGNKLMRENAGCLLLTSIANPQKMYTDLIPHYKIEQTIFLRDHQKYSVEAIAKIKNVFSKIKGENAFVLTTEKDAAKLRHPSIKKIVEDLPIYIIPIEIQFHKAKQFSQFISSKIDSSLKRL